MTGVLDKAAIGEAEHGLIHAGVILYSNNLFIQTVFSVHELCGPEVAGKLLSALSRLLVIHLQNYGHTYLA